MNKSILGLGLSALSVCGVANAETKSCTPDLNIQIQDLYSAAFRDLNAPTSEAAYMGQLEKLIASKCRRDQLSVSDVKQIIEAAVLVNDADLARSTNSIAGNMGNVTGYVKFGIEHALYGICASDRGAAGALRHCACTSIVINEQTIYSSTAVAVECQ